jgi:hypothetical protein
VKAQFNPVHAVKSMKISGARVGALVGFFGMGAVILLNLGPYPLALLVALISAGIGLMVGFIAGEQGKPLPGAAVGFILSGVAFTLFWFTCAPFIFPFDAGREDKDFLWSLLVFGLEMAVAGAVAGGIGGSVNQAAVGMRRD